jgi:hypothetical protein
LHETGNANWGSLFGINGANIFTNHTGGGAALVNTAFAPALSTTYMMAFTYDSTGATPTTFFIDPTGLGAGLTPSGSLASASFTGTNWPISGIGGIKFFAGNGLFTIDDVRVGTTWQDVSPVPEPSTYALLASGLGALFFLRRRFTA